MKWILLLALVLSCSDKSQKVDDTADTSQKSPDNVFWDYSTVITSKDIRKYKIWSGMVERYNYTKKTFCYDSLIVTFFDEKDHLAKNQIHSQKGIWNENSNNFQAINNVVVVNFKGHILKTDTLFYDNRRDKIYSNTNVMFYNQLDTLYGTSFVSNVDLTEIDIENASGVSSRNK